MKNVPQIIENLKAWRRVVVWVVQIAAFICAGTLAFLLRFDFTVPTSERSHLAYALFIWTIVKIIVFRVAQLDRGLWRYVTVFDVIRVALGNIAASIISYFLISLTAPSGFPRSIYVLDLIACFLITTGLRLATRIFQEFALTAQGSKAASKAALIYGAGEAGINLFKEIRLNPRLPYRIVGFVDDDPAKKGLQVAGVPVLGGGDHIDAITRRHAVKTILIAIPSATGAAMTRVLELCHAAGLECKTVPGLDEIIENHASLSQVREVAVQDLLGRIPVRLEEDQIRSTIEKKIILITGAAGSIGSELCRQIARFHPAGIVGFDIAESPLFEIEQEMHNSFPTIPFYAEIGSIQNRARLDEVLFQYRPLVVYHAAAYKHVPLMESHVFEAIENNVFGTYNVAEAAAEHGVQDMVMISSDKAVRPTNIMGATKRIAELILLALQNGRTKYVAVRFGNVLGSNGSVIPIFKKQIAAGGPVTVTHPEMRRFFMTIPEACQLVLQASAIGEGGQICVLDMGHPVKIVDLARNLILLSGLKPDQDIKIEFIGMRPGEKICEELSSLLEDTVATDHEKVRIFVGNGIPDEDIVSWLDSLHEICQARDVGRLLVMLKDTLPDYNPSAEFIKRAIGNPPRPARSVRVPVTKDSGTGSY
jgi:FlaA1/EpsC-like NDP-sugar epimerase